MSCDRFRRLHARPLVYGHRGASALATENTIEAFERAKQDGADGVELDVRLTACGAVVVFHDDDLVRLGERGDRIDALTLSELRGVTLRGGGGISTLEEVLEATDPMIVNVEVKTPGPTRSAAVTEGTLRALRRMSRHRERVLISSFDPTILLRLARRDRNLCLGLLFHHKQSLLLRRAWLAPIVGAVAVHPYEGMVTRELVDGWHRARRLVNVWTVDDPTRLGELATLGVDGVICNDPGAALDTLTAREERARVRSSPRR